MASFWWRFQLLGLKNSRPVPHWVRRVAVRYIYFENGKKRLKYIEIYIYKKWIFTWDKTSHVLLLRHLGYQRLTASLNVLKIQNCLHSQLTHSSDTHTYPTRHATRGLFTVPKSRTNSRKSTVLCRVLIAWNFLLSYIAQINSKPCFKKQIKQHLTAQCLSPI